MKYRRSLVTALFVSLVVLAAGCDDIPDPGRPKQQDGSHRSKVLAFTASWCGPCQRAKPTLAQIKAAGTDVQIINIDDQPDLARQYDVTSVPTFFVYVRGKQAVRTQDVSEVVSLIRSRR